MMGILHTRWIITFSLFVLTTAHIQVGGKVYKSWFIGRVPPSSFEYEQLNGFYSPKRAKYLCERDFQCGGFTFKGTTNNSTNKVEIYFFHFISDQASYLTTEIQYPHWTTYIDGNKDYIVIKGSYDADSGELGVIHNE